jgi:hypothetical protein
VRTGAPQSLSLGLEEYRIRASRLLKELRGTDLAVGLRAATVFAFCRVLRTKLLAIFTTVAIN